MALYLLSVHGTEDEAAETMTDEQMKESFEQMNALNDAIRSAGAWVFGGALHEPDTSTVVRPSDGELLTTDGPFAESKEHLGGFYIIDVPDLDAALGWARQTVAVIRKPIEVRPFRHGES